MEENLKTLTNENEKLKKENDALKATLKGYDTVLRLNDEEIDNQLFETLLDRRL